MFMESVHRRHGSSEERAVLIQPVQDLLEGMKSLKLCFELRGQDRTFVLSLSGHLGGQLPVAPAV